MERQASTHKNFNNKKGDAITASPSIFIIGWIIIRAVHL